jgi:predicted nicotinamide N-methyase
LVVLAGIGGCETAGVTAAIGRPDPWADVVEEVVDLPGGAVAVRHPRDGLDLLDEEAFEQNQFLPYWADLWPSAVALADVVARRPPTGKNVVELGCGIALPGIVAARGGAADVLLADWSPDAVAFAADNAARNAVRVRTAVASWEEPDQLRIEGGWDLLLASDVLYEERNVLPLLEALDVLAGPSGEVWITDPRRRHTPAFLELAAENWRVGTLPSAKVDRVDVHVLARPQPVRRSAGHARADRQPEAAEHVVRDVRQ